VAPFRSRRHTQGTKQGENVSIPRPEHSLPSLASSDVELAASRPRDAANLTRKLKALANGAQDRCLSSSFVSNSQMPHALLDSI
jgi:hypothetical protein